MRSPAFPPSAIASLAGLLASVVLAGCTPTPLYQENTAVQQQLTVDVATAETTLSPLSGARPLDGASVERLRRFVMEEGNPYAVRIRLTPGDRVADGVVKRVIAVLTAAGVPGRGISVSMVNRPVGNELRLRRETATAVLPDCPPLNRDTLLDRENDTPLDLGRAPPPPPRLGCATTANLGLMLADPRDLIEPQRSGPASGALAEDTVGRYRTNRLPRPGNSGVTSGAASESGNQ
ncbi:hypothetical protein AZL_001290 [Azospirillum sp. B510]|uniref:CpaD family pilus assembly lipoprotein n=1 Tax=Azospirillum sp. (strain B510) TaxID=137722 RepID=UPI0001C4B98B|nr:CpaD family pilus assembly lipoprotein [Azospirillum sp. B510]BAI70767.1 hypothetical protein AZL_001290 [Azospirillum sp. B510]